MTVIPPGDAELHAHVDGQLDSTRVAAVEAFLESSPEAAARVNSWRRDKQELNTAFTSLARWPSNPALDPVVIRRNMRARTIHKASLSALLLIALVLGGVTGWSVRSMSLSARLPMQDAVHAYRVFATDRLHPVELEAHDAANLQSWLSARLGRAFALADLKPYGFHLLGGRLLSTDEGPAGMILYENNAGERISFYLRPSTHFASGLRGRRIEGGLLASYWFRDGYGFALVGRAEDPRTAEIEAAIPATVM
jgi:anti-sigma factor RsiW